MNETEKGKVTVNGIEIPTLVCSANMEDFELVAEAGTTGFGDNKKECLTFLRIFNSGATNFVAHIHETENRFPQAVDLFFRGNAELDAFVELLLFAVETLTDQITEEAQ